MTTPSSEPHPPAQVFSSARRFKLWRYGVGHSQLLLRSLPTDDEPCLDILFEGVLWIELPTSFDSLLVSRATDREGILRRAAVRDGTRVLALTIAGSDVAGHLVCAKATAAYTPWTVTSPDPGSGAAQVLWTESPGAGP